MVPAAIAAVGGLAALVVVLRVVAEVALLKAEVGRAGALRPALVELRRDAGALRAHARSLGRPRG